MARIAFTFTKDSVNLTFPGAFKTIHRTHPFFNEVVKHIRNNELDSEGPIGMILNKAMAIKKSSNGLFDMIGESILYKGQLVSRELTNKILDYCDNSIPYDSLFKFHENLDKNPSSHVKEKLWVFLDRAGHPITEDGCFIAYRKCRNDYMDGHSGKFRNMIGDVCVMDREDCDSNPNNTCSRGLHAASYNYAKDFLTGGHLMAVKINPCDVVSVPNEYNAEKLRCCRFEVIDEIDKPYQGIVFTNSEKQTVVEDESDSNTDSTTLSTTPTVNSFSDEVNSFIGNTATSSNNTTVAVTTTDIKSVTRPAWDDAFTKHMFEFSK